MPGLPPPVADERDALRQFLDFNQRAFFAVAYGLTDEQARSTPTVSALSIGGLIRARHRRAGRVAAAIDRRRPISRQATIGRSTSGSPTRPTSA